MPSRSVSRLIAALQRLWLILTAIIADRTLPTRVRHQCWVERAAIEPLIF